MFFTSCAPMSANCTDSLLATCSCTERETQMPPASARPSRRAAMLTPSPTQVAVTLHHVSDRDADTKAHLAAGRIGHVPGAQAFLDIDGASHRFDGAWKFGENGVTGGVENPAAGSRDKIIGDRPVGGQTPQRLLLVLGNQTAVTGNIGRKNRRDLAFHESRPRTTVYPGRMPPEVHGRNRVTASAA